MILKDTIYKHQIFSIILASIGWIFISIPIYEILKFDDIIPNIIYLFGAIFYPLYLVFLKYIILKYYTSVLLDMIIIGILLMIISALGLSIYSLIDCNNLSYLKNIFDVSIKNNYFIIALIFGVMVKMIFCYIINFFSPNIFVLTNVISTIIDWISKIIRKQNNDSSLNIVFKAIGYFIIFFSTLAYNEIIIFNFFGLNKNTTNDIDERAKKEEKLLKKENINDQKDENSDDSYLEVEGYLVNNSNKNNSFNESENENNNIKDK